MTKFCTNCGSALTENTKFCPGCGTPVPQSAPPIEQNATQDTAQPYIEPASEAPANTENGTVRNGIPASGFSDRVNHPEILAAVKKNRKAAGIFTLIIIPLPFIGFIIYSLVSDKMKIGQAAMIGGIISAIFIVFALYSFIKSRAKNTYEAMVIDKKSRITYRNQNSDDKGSDMVTEYTTIVRTSDGKKKKIVEQDRSQMWAWNYLQVGDRFKYHPQFNFPYELYDKSQAPFIACISCPAHNPVEADRCEKCGLPLLK